MQRQLVLIRLYCHTPTGMQSPEMKLLTTVKSCYLKPFLQPPYMVLYFIIFTLFFFSHYIILEEEQKLASEVVLHVTCL